MLRCSVEELGRRVSSPEFEEWKVMFSVEDLHPSGERQRHAQLLAAIHNGAMTRRDRRAWLARDFDPGSMWEVVGSAKAKDGGKRAGGKRRASGKRQGASQAMSFAAYARAATGR